MGIYKLNFAVLIAFPLDYALCPRLLNNSKSEFINIPYPRLTHSLLFDKYQAQNRQAGRQPARGKKCWKGRSQQISLAKVGKYLKVYLYDKSRSTRLRGPEKLVNRIAIWYSHQSLWMDWREQIFQNLGFFRDLCTVVRIKFLALPNQSLKLHNLITL